MDFIDIFRDSLDKNDLTECSTLLYSIENIQLIDDASWDLSSLFCTCLTNAKADNASADKLDFIKSGCVYICQMFGNPKELFLVYLENTEAFYTDESMYALLVDLLQTLLLRLSARFIFYSLELAINQLSKYIGKQTAESNKDLSKPREQLINSTNKFVDFLVAFIEKEQQDASYNLKGLLTNTLINLFYEPFLSIGLTELNEQETLLIQRILGLVYKLHLNYFKLIKTLERQNTENDTVKLNRIALGSFVSFVYLSGLDLSCQSALVYERFFLFRSFVPLINNLLNQPQDENCLEKGVKMINSFMDTIEVNSIDGNVLEIYPIVQSFQLLFRVAVYATKESLRQLGVSTLRNYFEHFDRRGRYTVLNYFLNDNSQDQTLNNYVSSYLVYLFKEEVSASLDLNETFYVQSNTNSNFKRLFRLIVKMKQGIQTDLMQESSKITAILNMLRFVLIRDKQENRTHIFDMLKESEYLNELKISIQFSKEHYAKEQKNLINMEPTEAVKCEVTTSSNETIKEPTVDDKLQSCKNALQSIDLLDSLRCRVDELFNERSI